MTKTLLLTLITIIFFGCVNANAIEKKYYTNCKEYYDFQGFYHDECEENKANNYYNNMDTKSDLIYKTVYKLLVEESKELAELKMLEEKIKLEEEEVKKLEEAIELEKAKKLEDAKELEKELEEAKKLEDEKELEEANDLKENKELEDARKFEIKIEL